MTERGARPRSVEWAVYILTAALIYGVAGSVSDLLAIPDQPIVIGLMLGIIGLVLFNLYKIWQGRNWARVLYTALFILGLFSSLPQLPGTFASAPAQALLSGGLLLVQSIAIATLYLSPSKDWFHANGI